MAVEVRGAEERRVRILDQRLLVGLGGDPEDEARVAGYIAKYATKGAESAGTVDRPIRTASAIPYLDVTEHARHMIQICWLLADMPEYVDHGLRRWSHMLGFRGHFLTKSRAYSTTFTTLRTARAEYRAAKTRDRFGISDGTPTLTAREWTYAGRETVPRRSG